MIKLQFIKGLFRFGTLYYLDDCIPFSPAWDLLWLGSLLGFSCEIPSINAAFSQDCSIGSDHHLKSNDFEHLLLLLLLLTYYKLQKTQEIPQVLIIFRKVKRKWHQSLWANDHIQLKRIPCISVFSTHSTMLQKLSKCEVKAWLCWILIILPALRFFVKPNFGKFYRSKKCHLAILEVLNSEIW